MNCGNHKIELKSCESFVIHREIFRVFGSIFNPCECQEVEIRLNYDGNDKVPLFNKTFKHLIRLKRDCENLIELIYCCAKLELKIQHKTVDDVKFDVQPLYIVPKNHNGKFQSTDEDENGIEEAKLKIDLGLKLAQCIIATKLNQSMKGERIFELRNCETFHSDLDVDDVMKVNQWELYDAIAAELVKTNDVTQRKFVGFLSCTKFDGLSEGEEYSYINIKSKTFANPALGGGFLCLMGSGCFYSWPSHVRDVTAAFSDKTRIDISRLLDDSNYRKTYGGCFATSLGTLIHELGHVFDLAHTETGLMGNDIDYIHRFFLAENFTEILPKRNVRSCQLTEGETTGKIANPRFTKVKKPGGEFLDKYREQKDNDMTFFEPNCAITLWNHRWFTQCTNVNDIELHERTLKSKSPLKLVEVRELPARNSMLINFWSLMDKNVNEFAIPTNVKLKNVALFSISRDGDVFKREFSETFA